MKNILIVGTGALSTFFAARLAASGASVSILGTWQNAIEAFNRSGARLLMADGSILTAPVLASSDASICGHADLVLVLVKSWQTARVADQLQRYLPEQALVVTLQNGLGNREYLSQQLGGGRVALGVTTTGATLLGPGLARMGGDGLISLEAHPAINSLYQLLRAAQLNVEIVSDANMLVWGKLVINTAINPLTALLSVPNGALLEKPAARLVMDALARETANVASALGICLPFSNPVSVVEDVARRTAANRSSMFQDVKRGAPTEIDAICGAVVRAGQSRGVSAPVNWTMWQLISALNPG